MRMLVVSTLLEATAVCVERDSQEMAGDVMVSETMVCVSSGCESCSPSSPPLSRH